MGSKRSAKKMEQLHDRFARGCRDKHGMDEATVTTLWKKTIAFAAYGFPESHAQSFASIVYFSAWFKRYYPAEFCVALLRAQPMGFTPHSHLLPTPDATASTSSPSTSTTPTLRPPP